MNKDLVCNVIVGFIYLLLLTGIQAGLYVLGSPPIVWFWDLLFKGFK